MMSHSRSALLGATALVAMSGGAFAQNPPSPPTPLASAWTDQRPLYDPQQLPASRGRVLQFTLTPRGEIDGLILTDGTEVKTPPHLSSELAYSVKPGDTVTVHGLKAAALPLVQAASVTDEANGQTVIDSGPPGPGGKKRGPPPPVDFGQSDPGGVPAPGLNEIQGRVRASLHGPQGEVNGAVLEDGTILRLPPADAARFAALLQSGQTIVAQGDGFASAIGKVLDVRAIGASRAQLSVLLGPPGPGGKGRRPPPPGGPGFAPAPPRP